MMPSEIPPFEERWKAVRRTETLRTVKRTAIGFVITLLLASALHASLVVFSGADAMSLTPLAIAFIAAAIVGVTTTNDYPLTLRAALGDDRAHRTRVRRAVLRGEPETLERDDLPRAARWASIFAIYQPLIDASGLLNLAGIALLSLNGGLFTRRTEPPDPFLVVLLILIVAAGAAVIIFDVWRVRRTRAFALQHQQLLEVR